MTAYIFYSFIITISWLTLLCSILINLLELLQILSDINPVFLGLTCLAWANCIGGKKLFIKIIYQSLNSLKMEMLKLQ